MSNLFYDIQEAFIDGDTPERIAEALNIPVQMVTDAMATMGVDIESDYDDSMDGDAASALASAGWSTDEDYGGDCEYL
jgi:hypothetical protein